MSEKCKMSSVPTGSANLADVKCKNIDCACLMRLKKHFLTEEAESKRTLILLFFSFLNVKEYQQETQQTGGSEVKIFRCNYF